jgi:hypothetical protein
MSGYDLEKCPKCGILTKNIKKEYGTISEKEYLKSLKERDNEQEPSLRAGAEYIMDGQKLKVTWSCYCEKCGFEQTFIYEETL